ncbi:MAG: tryptophan-rich sensory protein [Candidatus Vogelbacteria bacterium]|nr:tryptophan-rich sensory protein [Candidatus Vogelbacteria bacterium]
MKKLKLIISLAIPLIAGYLGSLFTNPSINSGWYKALPKPELVPPNIVFPIVWTTLFVLMGVAFYLVWKKSTLSKPHLSHLAYLLFAAQLILNVWWSILFFYLQRPSWALLEIIVLWFFILFTMLTFKKIDRRAGWLLLPYILWVTFAIYLNYSIALG